MYFRFAVVAATLLGAIAFSLPAEAQRVPQGSYRRSCSDIGVWGADTLVATCRTRDGQAIRTGLPDVNRCVGDIGNNNGILQCTLRGGRLGRGYAMGGPPVGGPPPYAAPPPPGDYGRGEARERCRRLSHQADELRDQREQAFDPHQRERIEHRLHEVRERLRDCY